MSTKTGVWKRSAMSKACVAEVEALLHRAGQQHDVLGVAVGEECGGEQVGLRGARGHAGRGAGALHVEDDAGDLGEVAEAGELGHERNAGTGGGGHGARARPAGAEHHADGGEFVFGLDHGEGGFAFRGDAELLEQVSGGFDQATWTA